MVLPENLKKLLSAAQTSKIIIICANESEMWDLKRDIRNFAIDEKNGAEMTSTGVRINGYSPITVTYSGAVWASGSALDGTVFVTDKATAERVKDMVKGAKTYLLPVVKF